MVLTNVPINASFDLDDFVGQRNATFRFTLINGVTNAPIRDITPIRDSVPTLTHDATRTIPRTLNIELGTADTAVINTINNRVLVYMVINGREWPLGRYMFASNPRERTSAGHISSATLTDEMFIVDQALETAFSALVATSLAVTGFGDRVTSREQIDQTARRLLAPLNVFSVIASTPYSSIGAWPVGTSRARILSELAVDGDFFSPWFDHTGVLRMKRTTNPDRVVPDFDFDVRNRVFRDTIAETNNLLQAANRVVIVSNGTSSDVNARAPIVGTFDVPNSAPHSIVNRGFVIPEVQTRQVESVQQANAVARAIALNLTAYEFVDLTTPPDPRHDSWNVIRWNNQLWLETSWSMALVEGGAMRHSLQRMYSNT